MKMCIRDRSTDEDTRRNRENREREQQAFRVCQEKIAKHSIDMKLVDVEYNFEGTKILFFFTSDAVSYTHLSRIP